MEHLQSLVKTYGALAVSYCALRVKEKLMASPKFCGIAPSAHYKRVENECARFKRNNPDWYAK